MSVCLFVCLSVCLLRFSLFEELFGVGLFYDVCLLVCLIFVCLSVSCSFVRFSSFHLTVLTIIVFTATPPCGSGLTTPQPCTTTSATAAECWPPTARPSTSQCSTSASSSVTTCCTLTSSVRSPQRQAATQGWTSFSLNQKPQRRPYRGWWSVTTTASRATSWTVGAGVGCGGLRLQRRVPTTRGTRAACGSRAETTAAVCPTPCCATTAGTARAAGTRISAPSRRAAALSSTARMDGRSVLVTRWHVCLSV